MPAHDVSATSRATERDGARKDVVALGLSAGGVEVLLDLVARLPADFDATLLVVLHTSPGGPGLLPQILNRVSRLPVSHGIDGQPIERGRIYVAPPDRHLMVTGTGIRLTMGPRENHTRPAIDPLFRSVALTYGPRAIGVVMTGLLDDGTAGLAAIKERGGTTIVQDPNDAMYPDMPRSAIDHVEVDHVIQRRALPALLQRLSAQEVVMNPNTPVPKALEIETRIGLAENALEAGVMTLGEPSKYTCPDCHGVLLHVKDSPMLRFRCHTGHAYSADSLLATVTGSAEDAVWNAFRALEESVMLLREMADEARDRPNGNAASLDEQADRFRRRASQVRDVVTAHPDRNVFSAETATESAEGAASG